MLRKGHYISLTQPPASLPQMKTRGGVRRMNWIRLGFPQPPASRLQVEQSSINISFISSSKELA